MKDPKGKKRYKIFYACRDKCDFLEKKKAKDCFQNLQKKMGTNTVTVVTFHEAAFTI